MKYIIITFFALGIAFNACNSDSGVKGKPAEVKADSTQNKTVYACPMHPEVTGNKGDTCRICGMDLEKK